MLKQGMYVLVLNFNHVLACRDTVDECEQEAEQHSLNAPRGHYAIYKLSRPEREGRMGDGIEWK
jgi:hypothetical protein